MKYTFELDDDLKERMDALPHGARKLMLNNIIRKTLDVAEEDVWRFMSGLEKGYLRVRMGEPK